MGRRNVALALVLLCGGCADERLTVLLVDDACRCDSAALGGIGGVRVTVRGSATRESACLAPSEDTRRLASLQGVLRAVQLGGLKSGSYELSVVGYEDASCSAGVLACGHSNFVLPGPSAAIDVPLRCQRGSDGKPLAMGEAVCLEQTFAPDRCSGPTGDGAPGGDGGSGPQPLMPPALQDDGTCSASWLRHTDSMAVALYTPDGKVVVRRKCFELPTDPTTVAEALAVLPTPVFSDVAAGDYLLLVTLHDNLNCGDDDVIGCSGGATQLPAAGAAQLTIGCFDEVDPITEAACLASVK